jgi:hypothetical protein
MEDFLWVLPALACGGMMVAMVVMMLGMGKSMLSGGKKDDEGERSLDELRAEQKRMAEEIERLQAREHAADRDRAASPTG